MMTRLGIVAPPVPTENRTGGIDCCGLERFVFMQFLWMSMFALGIVGLDQWTKWLVLEYIPLGGHVNGIPGLFHLTHVRNTGAAFSSFQGAQWLFALIFVILTLAILYEYFKKPLPFTRVERWMIAGIYGGGLGNMIDRLRFQYVVDMIEVDFVDFAVFNVADCFITCGCIALIVSLVFFNKKFWKDEKKCS